MNPVELQQKLQPVTLRDREEIVGFYKRFPQEICECTFAERFLWGESRNHLWGELEGHLIVSYQKRDEKRKWYPPVGKEPLSIMKTVMHPKEGFHFAYVTENLAHAFLNDAIVTETPNHFDYMYHMQSMRSLEGKAYGEKRNFINRAKKHLPQIIQLTPTMRDACIDLLRRWAAEQPRDGENSLLDEESALHLAMDHFTELDLFGIGIKIADQLEAFSFGCPISDTIFVEYFEKATTTIPGLYPLVLHELCNALPDNFRELNFEEDLGIPGLRIAKQRWNPKRLIKKFEISA